MNTENMNQNIDPASTQGAGEKTFTQDDVNRIVQDRLAKDRAKSSEEITKREQVISIICFTYSLNSYVVTRQKFG